MIEKSQDRFPAVAAGYFSFFLLSFFFFFFSFSFSLSLSLSLSLQGQLSLLTHVDICSMPRATAVARKDSGHSAKSAGARVAKHTCTLRM